MQKKFFKNWTIVKKEKSEALTKGVDGGTA